jgi:hypothetical protein
MGQCKQWKDMYNEPPAWGETGAGSEIITEHIMCCAPHAIDSHQRPGAVSNSDTATTSTSANTSEESPDFNWEQQVYQNIGSPYQVAWFSRATGWDGTTMKDALQFCAKKQTILCPFESVCVDGPDNPPIGGEKLAPDGGVAWTPVISKEEDNLWVSVSKPDLCIKYTNEHPNAPEWGVNGGNEAETRNVACCKATGVAASTTTSDADSSNAASESTNVVSATPPPTPEPTPQPTPSPTIEPPTPPPTTPTVTETISTPSSTPTAEGKAIQMLYDSISQIHNPVWFDRSSGWNGQTWQDAKLFCEGKVYEDNMAMQLCQLGAYCPIPKQTPMQGKR